MAQFGAPNFLQVIDAYEAGSRRAERNRLAELDQLGRQLQGQALSGDQNALARLGEVNPQAYMQTKQFTQQEKAQRLDELAAGAMAADTPEKWQAFVRRAAAQGHHLDPGETRESILDQAMGWKEKLAQSNADRQFNASQTNADRSYDLQRRGFEADQSYRAQQIQLEKEKMAVEAGKSMRPDLKDITAIRKEIGDLPSYKTYSAALPVYNSMAKAADTKAGDLNLVYGLAKIFDPTSVVREGEQVLVRDTASLPDWLVGQINSLNGGNRLLAETRKSLMAEARNRVDAYKGAYESNLQPYRGIAGRYQINEADIIPQMGALEEVPANGQGDPLGIR